MGLPQTVKKSGLLQTTQREYESLEPAEEGILPHDYEVGEYVKDLTDGQVGEIIGFDQAGDPIVSWEDGKQSAQYAHQMVLIDQGEHGEGIFLYGLEHGTGSLS